MIFLHLFCVAISKYFSGSDQIKQPRFETEEKQSDTGDPKNRKKNLKKNALI